LRKNNQKKVYSITMSTPISELPYNTATNKVTELPERDIPRETITHTTDAQVTPTYMPPKPQEYIEHQPVQYHPPTQSKMEKILEEFKLPILVLATVDPPPNVVPCVFAIRPGLTKIVSENTLATVLAAPVVVYVIVLAK